jgi:NAD(P)-dependent dehydrogenase (short-subunit alcohol dehydrogenase family)
VIGEVGDVSTAIVAALSGEGYRVRQVLPGATARQLAGNRYEVDLSSPSSVQQLHKLVGGPESAPVGAVINFLGLSATFQSGGLEAKDTPMTAAAWTFNLVKEFVGDLQSSADEGGGWFINVTGLGGHFGLGEEGTASFAAAGTLGIIKTLRREYPRLHVKAIDVDPTLPADMLATRLLLEAGADDDLVEVGLTGQGRRRPDLIEQTPTASPSPPFDRDSVILVTGGAYGVTADVARALAVAAKPRLILVGRSPLPAAEAARTKGLDRAALRKLFLDDIRVRGEPVVPAEIERSVNRLLKDRQIHANLDACTAAGATVEYRTLDVRDDEPFAALIDELYERFGRIDGVIHGAGVIEDRRIADKTLDSFANVFRTKVDSALTLARKLRPEGLKFLAFFGSVSGRFGNAGQVDYSAANEVLNKLADHLQGRWPGRVVCLNWGPWDGGMISEELRRLYTAAGVELIPIEEGVAAFLAEISQTERRSAEVVIACGVEQMLLQKSEIRNPKSERNGKTKT